MTGLHWQPVCRSAPLGHDSTGPGAFFAMLLPFTNSMTRRLMMNELTLLQAMRDQTPVATDAAVEDGRKTLLRRIDPSLPRARPTHRRRTAKRVGIISLATAAIVA